MGFQRLLQLGERRHFLAYYSSARLWVFRVAYYSSAGGRKESFIDLIEVACSYYIKWSVFALKNNPVVYVKYSYIKRDVEGRIRKRERCV